MTRQPVTTRLVNRPEIMPVRQRTDEALIEAYVGGDRHALPQVIRRYHDELLHFLIRFLGSRPAGEDVFQETFLQIHLSAHTFDVSRRFKPWLFTIAANKARDYYRKNKRRRTLSLSAPVLAEDDNLSFVDLMQSDVNPPDTLLLDAERSMLVRRVVDELPVHLREILLLSYFQKMSYNQVAEVLEIPLGTVKSRLHSAVASFADRWMAACEQESSVPDSGTRSWRQEKS